MHYTAKQLPFVFNNQSTKQHISNCPQLKIFHSKIWTVPLECFLIWHHCASFLSPKMERFTTNFNLHLPHQLKLDFDFLPGKYLQVISNYSYHYALHLLFSLFQEMSRCGFVPQFLKRTLCNHLLQHCLGLHMGVFYYAE